MEGAAAALRRESRAAAGLRMPVKAPPPHLAARRGPPLRRGDPPVKAPPVHVSVMMQEPLPEIDDNERRADCR